MSMDDVRIQDEFEDLPSDAVVIFNRQWGTGMCTLEIRGDLDIAVSGLLRQELDELLDQEISRLDLDLSAVQFMDSSALSALVQTHERAKERGQQFNLLRPSPACTKVLSITGLDRVFGLT